MSYFVCFRKFSRLLLSGKFGQLSDSMMETVPQVWRGKITSGSAMSVSTVAEARRTNRGKITHDDKSSAQE